jgi:hypothetical protein
MKISQDGSGAKGGDLGWSALNRMVKPFNDVIFYKAEPVNYIRSLPNLVFTLLK